MRDHGTLSSLRDFTRDVRYCTRSLQRSRGFATIAILTLALGIGAATTIYSIVDTILLQPLPFRESERLVRVVENVAVAGRPPIQRGVTYQEFLEWRARSRTLAGAFAVSTGDAVVQTDDGRARLWGGRVSSNTFTMLATLAILGRTLTPADDANPDVVVLSFDTWQRRFHSSRDVVGATLEFRADFNASRTPELERPRLLTVVGVMPPAFELPTGPMDFYTMFEAGASTKARVTMVGRMQARVPLADAAAEANAIGSALLPALPANAPAVVGPRFELELLKERIVQGLRPALRLLLASVAIVLVIVCANVANLLLSRATSRQREIAVRVALGASRLRIVREAMTECLLLAAAGGAGGALVAAGGVTLVKHLASLDAPGIFRLGVGTSILPRGSEVGADLRMFGIAFGIAAVTSLMFGVLPALFSSRTASLQAMGSRGGGARRGATRLRAALVVAQFIMATVLLVGAGLLIRTFVNLTTVERGYDPSNVLAFQLVFPTDYAVGRKVDTIERILARLRAAPGVEAAGFSRAGILIGEAITIGTFVPQGRSESDVRSDPVRPLVRAVSSGYLTAAGVRLLDGREFNAGDTASSPPAIVISRTVARRYFGTVSSIGQVLDWHAGGGPATPMQIVGVVEDLRNTAPERQANPEIFLEYRQLLALQQRWGDSPQRQEQIAIGFLSFAIRTSRDPASAAPVVSRIVRDVDSNTGIDAMIPLARLVATSVARPRFYAVLLGVFAGVASILAAIGVYGVLTHAVTERTREIGIRMALGAQRIGVLWLVLQSGVMLAAVGIAIGLAGASIATRLLQSLLFGITPLDATTFVSVPLLFAALAMLASYVPARRATGVDPMVALRDEG